MFKVKLNFKKHDLVGQMVDIVFNPPNTKEHTCVKHRVYIKLRSGVTIIKLMMKFLYLLSIKRVMC